MYTTFCRHSHSIATVLLKLGMRSFL